VVQQTQFQQLAVSALSTINSQPSKRLPRLWCVETTPQCCPIEGVGRAEPKINHIRVLILSEKGCPPPAACTPSSCGRLVLNHLSACEWRTFVFTSSALQSCGQQLPAAVPTSTVYNDLVVQCRSHVCPAQGQLHTHREVYDHFAKAGLS
jgi:hypothetical protein